MPKKFCWPVLSNTSIVIYRDELSGVRLVELGVGLTVSDILILAWTPIFLNRTATILHKIDVADGMRAFIRIRATNNGKCYETNSYPTHIVIYVYKYL